MVETATGNEVCAEIIHLDIKECLHCNFCLSRQKPGRYCSFGDEARPVFEKIERAVIVILTSPVNFMRTSAKMAAFIDRLRARTLRLSSDRSPRQMPNSADLTAIPGMVIFDSRFLFSILFITYV